MEENQASPTKLTSDRLSSKQKKGRTLKGKDVDIQNGVTNEIPREQVHLHVG